MSRKLQAADAAQKDGESSRKGSGQQHSTSKHETEVASKTELSEVVRGACRV